MSETRRRCEQCGADISARRSDVRFCSGKCWKRAYDQDLKYRMRYSAAKRARRPKQGVMERERALLTGKRPKRRPR